MMTYISILACEDKAHLAAFTEQDEKFYGFALELPGTLIVMAEVLIGTLRVKINWILVLGLVELFLMRVTSQIFLCLILAMQGN